MIASAFIIGNLVRKPETTVVKRNGEDLSITKFSLAVNHGFGKDAPVSYLDFVAFNGLGTSLAQYRDQGDQVGVQADIRQNRWDAQDGTKRSKVEFTARTIEYLRTKGDGGQRADATPMDVIAEQAPQTVAAPEVTEVVEAVTAEVNPTPEQAPIPF